MENDIEIHPFGNFIPAGATCLVLGTFPTLKKNWRFNSFYPGRSNFFWRMLGDIYKHKFNYITGEDAAKERLALCASKGIAISDTIYSIRRKVNTSSKDSDLIVIQKMDILEMLKRCKTINTIILAGSSGKVSAHAMFYEHLKESSIKFEVETSLAPILGSFKLGGRTIKVATLYSTSGINIGRYAIAVEQFKKYLPK
jgi:G:T/U-mismatch repair DNA glycosylase